MSVMSRIDQPRDLSADDPINDISESDQPIQYSELIQESAFLGEFSFPTILEGIQKQFEDYINIEEKFNYIDIFYNQFKLSYDRIKNDLGEEHPMEIKEVLDRIYQTFLDTIQQLLKMRLTISIPEFEAGSMHPQDLEFTIRKVYEFFILGSCDNFKAVITTDVLSNMGPMGENDEEYFQFIEDQMEKYSPLFTTITPTKFLHYCKDEEILNLYESGIIAGNFLRKYSPKFYQNEEFRIQVVNQITLIHQFKEDITKDQEEEV